MYVFVSSIHAPTIVPTPFKMAEREIGAIKMKMVLAHRVKLKRGEIISKVAFFFICDFLRVLSMNDFIIVQTRLRVNLKRKDSSSRIISIPL